VSYLKAIALVTESVIKSDLKDYFTTSCAEAGIALEFHNVTESCAKYSEHFRSHRNVITWNCRMPHWWSSKWGNNVLYVENSLLWQRAGIFVDHAGFFSNSNLSRKQTWRMDHDVDLDAFTRQHFGWEALSGGTQDGPVLVCLQNTYDSNLQNEFPLGKKHADKVQATMEILHRYLPQNRPVVIRPSPRFISHWNDNHRKYIRRSHWKVDWSGSFHDILPKFSALVTVNSTCASEAVTLGMPVAVIGTGAFDGSGAVLECAKHPERLREINTWRPSMEACARYAKAILGRHFLPYRSPSSTNGEFESWLRAAF
jgi:hypothetical protein